uniref:Uncharacterized protein n=1 Tax=Aegilops tauschii TaxID=37682 RepID=N1QPS6_AEGTA
MAASAASPEEPEVARSLWRSPRGRGGSGARRWQLLVRLVILDGRRMLALSHAAAGRLDAVLEALAAAGSLPPCWAEKEKKGGTSEVPVERPVEDVDDGSMGEAGEEIIVDALPPEVVDLEQEGKVDVRAEAHAVVQDVVVSEAPEVPELEVKSKEVVVRDTTKVHPAHQPEMKADEVLVRDTDMAIVV